MAEKKEKREYANIEFSIPRTPITNSFTITLKIGASRENWIDLSYYLEARGATELASQTMKICYDKKFIGPFSGDKRKKVGGLNDERKKFVAAAFTYVSYWLTQDENTWPNEFIKIIKSLPHKEIIDKRQSAEIYLPRSIVYYLCTSSEKLFKTQPSFDLGNKAQDQPSFESQYFDKEKLFLKFVKMLFEKEIQALTIEEMFQSLAEPSVLDIKASIKSFKKSKTVKK
ncbi:MAG TPA: hypothetical protein PKW17_13650 [Smithellaceae bacterium]|nr:hypothetical protein [Smithellaceae bacterium]